MLTGAAGAAEAADSAGADAHPFACGAIFRDPPPAPKSYTVVVDGDELAAAAAGLTVGAIRPSSASAASSGAVFGGAGGVVGGRPRSPTSTLEPLPAEHSGGEGGEGSPLAHEGSAAAAGLPLAMYVPGGALDVDAVEAHMVSLLQVSSLAGRGPGR